MDGDGGSFDATVRELFKNLTESDQFLGMIAEGRTLAASVRIRTIQAPITLEDEAKAKVIFDTYIVIKSVARAREQMSQGITEGTESAPFK